MRSGRDPIERAGLGDRRNILHVPFDVYGAAGEVIKHKTKKEKKEKNTEDYMPFEAVIVAHYTEWVQTLFGPHGDSADGADVRSLDGIGNQVISAL